MPSVETRLVLFRRFFASVPVKLLARTLLLRLSRLTPDVETALHFTLAQRQ